MSNEHKNSGILSKFDTEYFSFHPNFIFRITGEPSRLLQLTETGKTAYLIHQRNQCAQTLKQRTEPTCKILETKIPGLSEQKLSNNLLKLKRNIYNHKPIKLELIESIAGLLNDEELEIVSSLGEEINLYHDLKKQIVESYEKELSDTQLKMVELWDRNNFQQGLSYSNPKLFSDLTGIFSQPDKKIKPKKKRQLEMALVRYISRCAVKTSPLSTFTPSFVGSWETQDKALGPIQFLNQIENKIEFKAGLFQFIVDAYFQQYDEIKEYFKLKLNPSYQVTEQQIHLKILSAGASVGGRVWGIGESKTQFNINKMIQCIIIAFQKLESSAVTANQLIDSVLTLAPQLEKDMVDSFIKKLYEMSLIQVELNYQAQTDILVWGRQLFDSVDSDIARNTTKLIDYIESELNLYGKATPQQRVICGSNINSAILQIADLFGISPPQDILTPSFFENSYIKQKLTSIGDDLLSPFKDDFSLLTEMSPLFDIHQLAQANFADYFLDKYGEQGECHRVEEFINQFSTIYGIGQPQFVPDRSLYSPRTPVFIQFSEVIQEFNRYLIDSMKSDNAEVKLEPQKIQTILEKLPQAIINRGASHSYLGQISQSEGSAKFVINQVYSGHSGLLSRFLEVCDENQISQVKNYLKQISHSGEYAEIPGVFGFNANRHPKLTEHELDISPYAQNWADTEKVALEDLALVYDKKTHKVLFKRPDGKITDLWYHGFLMPLLLPSLQRILTMLGMNGVLIYVLPILRSGEFTSHDQITRIPRLSLGNIVLIRRSTLIPRKFIPSTKLSPAEFFVEIQAWRETLDLPNEAFIRVSPFDTNPDALPEDESVIDWSTVDFKNMKPFYVKFDNPRLVQLLYVALNKNNYPLVVTEALPDINDHHVCLDGESHVAELQFELTKKPMSK